MEPSPDDRKLIDQAKALLMERKNISEPEAYALLQKTSRDRRRSMVNVARSILLADKMK